jgi:hypothetical protein
VAEDTASKKIHALRKRDKKKQEAEGRKQKG